MKVNSINKSLNRWDSVFSLYEHWIKHLSYTLQQTHSFYSHLRNVLLFSDCHRKQAVINSRNQVREFGSGNNVVVHFKHCFPIYENEKNSTMDDLLINMRVSRCTSSRWLVFYSPHFPIQYSSVSRIDETHSKNAF